MNRARWIPLAVLAAVIGTAGRGVAATAGALPPHPRLLFNTAGITEFRQRVQRAPWKARWSEVQAAADKALAEKVELPPRGSNWSHHYVCPTHGARLKRGKQIAPYQWEHICPVGPHTLRGDPTKASLDFDGTALASEHGRLANLARDCGLLFQVTGERRYAEKARAILLAYAEKYLSYPLHDNNGREGRGARVASQPLTEASWVIPMAQAADLVWDTFSDEERGRLADRLFRPSVEHILLPGRRTAPNIQCRLNSAIGLVGFLLGDEKYLQATIDDPDSGYRSIMRRNVQADGAWSEGAWGYHFFAIDGIWPLTEAARNCGVDLYGPEFKRMFDAPLQLAMPNFVLPAFNDSGETSVLGAADRYELAYARYHDPVYAALLAKSRREGDLALWFGADTLPKAEIPASAGRNAEASGYAILQQGQGEQATWLCLKYGPHGGGHGHPDKNNVVLYARGQVLLPDPGTRPYGSPLHGGWDKTTLAHNTLVVDEASQHPAQGKCLAFGSERGVDYAMADAGPIYPGVRFVRTVALLGRNLVLFVDQVRADKPHTLDLAVHLAGAWAAASVPEAWATPAQPGYKYLKETRARQGAEPLSLRCTGKKEGGITLALAGGEPTQVVTGTGVGKSTEERIPVALFRRSAQETAFVWALALDGTPVRVDALPVRDGSGAALPTSEALAVRLTHGQETRVLLANPSGKAVRLSLPGGQEATTEAAVMVR